MYVFTDTNYSVIHLVILRNKSLLISFIQLSGRIRQQGLHLPTPDLEEGRQI